MEKMPCDENNFELRWDGNGSTCASDYEDKSRSSADTLLNRGHSVNSNKTKKPTTKWLAIAARFVISMVLVGGFVFNFISYHQIQTLQQQQSKEIAHLKARLNDTFPYAREAPVSQGHNAQNVTKEHDVMLEQLREHRKKLEIHQHHFILTLQNITNLTKAYEITQGHLTEQWKVLEMNERLFDATLRNLTNLTSAHENTQAQLREHRIMLERQDRLLSAALRNLTDIPILRGRINEVGEQTKNRMNLLERKIDNKTDISSKIRVLQSRLLKAETDLNAYKLAQKDLQNKYNRMAVSGAAGQHVNKRGTISTVFSLVTILTLLMQNTQ